MMNEQSIKRAATILLEWWADESQDGRKVDKATLDREFFSRYPKATLDDALKVARAMEIALRATAH